MFQATCDDASTRLTVVSERLRILSEQSSTGSAADPYAPATSSTSVNHQTLREVLAAETGMRHNRLMSRLYRRLTGTSARVTS